MTIEEFLDRLCNVRRDGGGWSARCPTHEDRRNSLSVNSGANGRVLLHCFAGCDKKQILATLGLRWSDVQPITGRVIPIGRLLTERKRALQEAMVRPGDDERRTNLALRLWNESAIADRSVTEIYLRGRGITIPVPAALRCHSHLVHRSGGKWPAMVGLVTRAIDATPIAIHRTFLSPDGLQKAPLDPQKMMLGPCRGGVVRLAPVTDLVMVGEGIETCLAAMQATGLPAWAALSTSGLRVLDLPRELQEVIVLADGDQPGETAALEVARRWCREWRRVRIARPTRGLDFNDMLLGYSGPSEGGVA